MSNNNKPGGVGVDFISYPLIASFSSAEHSTTSWGAPEGAKVAMKV
jgi:hypothetical protein